MNHILNNACLKDKWLQNVDSFYLQKCYFIVYALA